MKKAKKIERRHLITLVIAICISALAIIFQQQISSLSSLGYLGIFLIMLIGNASVFLPAPGIVLNVILGGTLPNPLLVGLFAGLGASLGEISGYLIGYSGSGIVTNTKVYKRIKKYVHNHGLVGIFLFALIPNPFFDVAGLAAGALGISWWRFFIVTACGKIIRSIILAYLGAASF